MSELQKVEILQEEYELFKDLVYSAGDICAKGKPESCDELAWKRLEMTLGKLGALHATHGIEGFLRDSISD